VYHKTHDFWRFKINFDSTIPMRETLGGVMSRILVVDDEKQVCYLLSELLNQFGHEVATETSGTSAIASLDDFQPDLVLADMLMPEMNGLEVLKKVKAWNPDTPVVILTGVDDEKIGQAAIDAGASDYITKPFTVAQLKTVLQVYLLMQEG